MKAAVLLFMPITLSLHSSVFGQDSLPTDAYLPQGDAISSAKGQFYELDYLETGRHRFSLASPYETVVTHLYFLEGAHLHPDSAAMTLNIPDPKGTAAKEKAIQLKQFLDGAGYVIDVDALPRDPNYTDSLTGLARFVPVRSEPDIFLYKKSRGWVYSWTTVQAIERLHTRIYPFGTMEWLPAWSRNDFLGLQLWQCLGVLLFILFTLVLHKLLTRLVSEILASILVRFIRKDEALQFLAKIARPISLLVLFFALQKVYPVLQFSNELNVWVVNGFRIMIPVFVMMILLQVVNLLMAFFKRRSSMTEDTLDDQLVPIARNLLKAIVVIAVVIYVFDALNVNITALIGGVAFGTLALALAAQDTIKNLFGSLIIFLDRPFRIGDWVVIGSSEGVVEEVNVRSTRIRSIGNSLISIPNGNIASMAVNNMGARAYRPFVTRISLHCATRPEMIELFVEGVRELVRNHPSTRKDGYEVYFDTINEKSLDILVYVFFEAQSWSHELQGRQMLLLSILDLSSRMGVQLASMSSGEETMVDKGFNASAISSAMSRQITEIIRTRFHEKGRSGTALSHPETDSEEGH
ncbi:MAG: hypothetical protein RLZZ165_662 [Bacteroidota bacterium]